MTRRSCGRPPAKGRHAFAPGVIERASSQHRQALHHVLTAVTMVASVTVATTVVLLAALLWSGL